MRCCRGVYGTYRGGVDAWAGCGVSVDIDCGFTVPVDGESRGCAERGSCDGLRFVLGRLTRPLEAAVLGGNESRFDMVQIGTAQAIQARLDT